MNNKLIKQIKDLSVMKEEAPFIIEIIPNDGLIFENIHQAIITYDDDVFSIYIFKGLFKKTFTGQIEKFKFENITDVEFGKYGFKHPYVKISFSEEKYLAFSYFEKIKSHQEQEKNIKTFFKKLKTIKNEQISE